jgi:hypothetical protein
MTDTDYLSKIRSSALAHPAPWLSSDDKTILRNPGGQFQRQSTEPTVSDGNSVASAPPKKPSQKANPLSLASLCRMDKASLEEADVGLIQYKQGMIQGYAALYAALGETRILPTPRHEIAGNIADSNLDILQKAVAISFVLSFNPQYVSLERWVKDGKSASKQAADSLSSREITGEPSSGSNSIAKAMSLPAKESRAWFSRLGSDFVNTVFSNPKSRASVVIPSQAIVASWVSNVFSSIAIAPSGIAYEAVDEDETDGWTEARAKHAKLIGINSKIAINTMNAAMDVVAYNAASMERTVVIMERYSQQQLKFDQQYEKVSAKLQASSSSPPILNSIPEFSSRGGATGELDLAPVRNLFLSRYTLSKTTAENFMLSLNSEEDSKRIGDKFKLDAERIASQAILSGASGLASGSQATGVFLMTQRFWGKIVPYLRGITSSSDRESTYAIISLAEAINQYLLERFCNRVITGGSVVDTETGSELLTLLLAAVNYISDYGLSHQGVLSQNSLDDQMSAIREKLANSLGLKERFGSDSFPNPSKVQLLISYKESAATLDRTLATCLAYVLGAAAIESSQTFDATKQLRAVRFMNAFAYCRREVF